MKKKKIFNLIGLLAIIVFSGLCACGGGGGGGGQPASSGGGGTTPTTPVVTSVEYFGTYYKETTGTLPANIPTATINIDGNIDDWTNIVPFIVDAADNKWTGDYAQPGTDITNVYLAKDANYLYCRIDLADGSPNTAVQYRIYLPENYIPNTTSWALPYLVIQGVFYNNQWRTELRSWDGTNWPLLATDIAAVGSACIEMRMLLSELSVLGAFDRRYVQAQTRSYPQGTTYRVNHDVTEVLDARFNDVSNKGVRESGIGTWTLYSDGKWSFSGLAGSNGKGANVPITGSGTYTISADGKVKISGSGWDGWQFGQQKGAGVIIGASLDAANNVQGIATLFRKGGVHTLTNEERHFTNFNRDNCYPTCAFGIAINKNDGSTTSYYSHNQPGYINTNMTAPGTYSRNSDGTSISKYPFSVGTIGVSDSAGNPVPGQSATKYIDIIFNGANMDDGKVISTVQINNQNRNRQRISISIKRPQAPLSNSSLAGEFFFVYYEEEGGLRKSGFGTGTSDGAGNCSLNMTIIKSDGSTESGTATGTYVVAPDGTVTFGGNLGPLNGAINEEGDTLVAANITDSSRQYVVLGVKSK